MKNKMPVRKTLEIRAHSVKWIEDLQKCIDKLSKNKYLAPYIKQHRLQYIDSRFTILDEMLDSGLLRA